MPFGLLNVAAMFQRSVSRVLAQHKEYAETYIDDEVIFPSNWFDRLKPLDAVLTALEELNFIVNFKKYILHNLR